MTGILAHECRHMGYKSVAHYLIMAQVCRLGQLNWLAVDGWKVVGPGGLRTVDCWLSLIISVHQLCDFVFQSRLSFPLLTFMLHSSIPLQLTTDRSFRPGDLRRQCHSQVDPSLAGGRRVRYLTGGGSRNAAAGDRRMPSDLRCAKGTSGVFTGSVEACERGQRRTSPQVVIAFFAAVLSFQEGKAEGAGREAAVADTRGLPPAADRRAADPRRRPPRSAGCHAGRLRRRRRRRGWGGAAGTRGPPQCRGSAFRPRGPSQGRRQRHREGAGRAARQSGSISRYSCRCSCQGPAASPRSPDEWRSLRRGRQEALYDSSAAGRRHQRHRGGPSGEWFVRSSGWCCWGARGRCRGHCAPPCDGCRAVAGIRSRPRSSRACFHLVGIMPGGSNRRCRRQRRSAAATGWRASGQDGCRYGRGPRIWIRIWI